MPKFIITWDAGYGQSEDVIEADSYDEALNQAYECWRDEAESHANYEALEYTEENCDDNNLEYEQ